MEEDKKLKEEFDRLKNSKNLPIAKCEYINNSVLSI